MSKVSDSHNGRAHWAKLPIGQFTGIDWSQEGVFEGSDPYLAWAETSGFAGFRSPQGQSASPKWLPILVELQDGYTLDDVLRLAAPHWLRVPKIYQAFGHELRFFTARVKRGFFRSVTGRGKLKDIVKRYELGLPVGPHAKQLPEESCAKAGHVPKRQIKTVGPAVIVIDNGLALGHSDFRHTRTGRSRVATFWRQDSTQGPHGRASASPKPRPLDPKRAGPTPTEMGYGHELDAKAINAAFDRHMSPNGKLNEDGLYMDLQMWEMQSLVNHGTHVAALFAAPLAYEQTLGTEDTPPDWSPTEDPASKANLVAVQLDWASVADTSGGATKVSILDALAFSLASCKPGSEATVNLSWGALAGAHNGSSTVETAMNNLIACSGVNAHLVIPAGNSYQSRTHANASIEHGKSAELHWRVQPDDHSQSFLELWFETSGGDTPADGTIELELTPPGAQHPIAALALGASGVWPNTNAPQCAAIFPHRSALGNPGTCAVIALAPTAAWENDVVLGRAGVWTVKVRNRQATSVIMDAYVERDDVPLGIADTGARQSYLQDPDYDTSGGLHCFVDHPDNPSLVRRSGTFNDLATGPGTTSVGGIRHFASAFERAALYSPRNPDPDASRPERKNVRKVPSVLAISDDSAALWGVRSAGTRSASSVRLVGTSMASPQVARDRLNRT